MFSFVRIAPRSCTHASVTMNTIPEIKACESCAKSKRKCGKEMPGCHRCTSRNLPCVYPQARPTSFVRLQDDPPHLPDMPYFDLHHSKQQPTPPAEVDFAAVFDLPKEKPGFWDPSILFTPVSDFDVPLSDCPAVASHNGILQSYLQPPARIATPPKKHLDYAWFLSPETWKTPDLQSFDRQERASDTNLSQACPISTLKRFLKKIQRRAADWVTRGSNDFIHKELYAFRSARCIQDAQTTLALYQARTDENEEAVFQTLHARATQLLKDEEKYKTWSSHDVFSHLARCQALLTYQIVGLLDGDIQLRRAAEDRIETLSAWLDQLLESTNSASALCFHGSHPTSGDPVNTSPSAFEVANAFGLGIKDIFVSPESDINDRRISADYCVRAQRPPSKGRPDVVWHTWIFAESLRRTWITAICLHTSYEVIRTGVATCGRSMKLTAGQGMWDAPTSYAWEKRCLKGDVLFVEGWELPDLFDQVRPEDVDQFSKSCMEATCGVEAMERWQDSAMV